MDRSSECIRLDDPKMGSTHPFCHHQQLEEFEIFWRDHYDWLKEKGYLLCPRYHPTSVASWARTGSFPHGCEDFQMQPQFDYNMDAICIADGKPIMLRRPDPLLEEGRNFTRVLSYLVRWDQTELETVGELVDFCSQVFQGLQYIHALNIAHNDAKLSDIMIDWLPLECNCSSSPPLQMQPGYGGDQSVPEFKWNEPCDPFAVDVYCLGNVIWKKFFTGEPTLGYLLSRNVRFLKQLPLDMTHEDPAKQPMVDEVVGCFKEIQKGLNWWKLHFCVSDKTACLFFYHIYSLIHCIVQLSYMIQ
ncbi:hypothetical protein GYMLUDRAFT_1025315 [Collybiopsis luxurians FD-317 M1]|uniref:Unplaced genomic scaffold GYMLUscaffold_79, whole genome shotgun sequence n=1 Tax=Collybiopsis luxurians FD-317 M1 TaxID=944289 RepID=A0A0D0BFY4_9AGAR|nr:hypothetical protein GYMLUDRAFT_1025315 [Collybiopsis luxurians FD-317 M1]